MAMDLGGYRQSNPMQNEKQMIRAMMMPRARARKIDVAFLETLYPEMPITFVPRGHSCLHSYENNSSGSFCQRDDIWIAGCTTLLPFCKIHARMKKPDMSPLLIDCRYSSPSEMTSLTKLEARSTGALLGKDALSGCSGICLAHGLLTSCIFPPPTPPLKHGWGGEFPAVPGGVTRVTRWSPFCL